jgi:uncharacterized protein (UPF0332 family)
MRLKECFEKGLLRRVPKNPDIINKTIEMAENDSVEAQNTYSSGSYVWAAVQAYTSMLNCARAILFFDGIKEKSHFCTVEYLRANYSGEYGDLIDKLDILRRERHLSLYDSREHVTSEKVRERIEWCRQFLKKTKELLKKI